LWGSWLVDRSRMNREVHVRVCEGLRGKFPRSTRLTTFIKENFNFIEVVQNDSK
jgi:hypothetical protein